MHLVGLLSSYFAHDARSHEPKAMKILSVVKVHKEAPYTVRCPYVIEATGGNYVRNRDKKIFLISQAKITRRGYQIRALFSDSNY